MEGKKIAIAFLAVLGVVGVVAVVALYGGASPMAAHSELDEAEFQAWMVRHGKNHTGDEYNYRLAVYLDNRAKIEAHNKLGHNYTLGINHFADLPNDEFRQLYTSKMVLSRPRNIVLADPNYKAPSDVNWVNKNDVVKVLNQG
jgi:hypothetical protein